MLTQIETAVLERMAENLTDPQVWSGEGDQVRVAVQSAIDELLALGLFHQEAVGVELASGVSIYPMSGTGTVIGVLSARIDSQQRVLEHRTLPWISEQDRIFLQTRGVPWVYSVMDFTKVLVYPTPSSGGDILELECFIIPDSYGSGPYLAEITGELWEAVISLAVCNLQLVVPNGLPMAVAAFKDFVEMVPGAEGARRGWNSFWHFYQKGLGDGNGS